MTNPIILYLSNECISMGTLSEYYGDALSAVLKTLLDGYASEIVQDIADYLGAYYTEEELDDMESTDEDFYHRLLLDAVNEFVGENEIGLLTDLFVDEFENICIDEDVCDDILNDNSITQSYLDYAVRHAKESYNIDEDSKCDLAFAVLVSELSFAGLPEYLFEDIENKYDIADEIKSRL